jgi:hypothetical protein
VFRLQIGFQSERHRLIESGGRVVSELAELQALLNGGMLSKRSARAQEQEMVKHNAASHGQE